MGLAGGGGAQGADDGVGGGARGGGAEALDGAARGAEGAHPARGAAADRPLGGAAHGAAYAGCDGAGPAVQAGRDVLGPAEDAGDEPASADRVGYDGAGRAGAAAARDGGEDGHGCVRVPAAVVRLPGDGGVRAGADACGEAVRIRGLRGACTRGPRLCSVQTRSVRNSAIAASRSTSFAVVLGG